MKIKPQYLSIINACLVTFAIAPLGNSQPPNSNAPQATNVYPKAIVDLFMNQCVGNSGSQLQPFCACTIERIQKNYTIDQFIQIGQDLQSGKPMPDQFNQIVRSCLSATPTENEQPNPSVTSPKIQLQ